MVATSAAVAVSEQGIRILCCTKCADVYPGCSHDIFTFALRDLYVRGTDSFGQEHGATLEARWPSGACGGKPDIPSRATMTWKSGP